MAESDSRVESGPLKTLLAEARLREETARRKAVWYTLVPLVIGIGFLGLSFNKVSRLQQAAASLDQEITKEKAELVSVRKERAEAEADVVKAKAALRDINQNPKNAQQTARQALGELSWAVAVAAVKNMEKAGAVVAQVKELGYQQVVILQKAGWLRIIVVFDSKSEATANVAKIRASFPEDDDNGVRDMNQWCANRTLLGPGMFKCQD
jgi:cell division septation protein DedD